MADKEHAFSCGCEGKSGIPLSVLTGAIRDLKIDADDDLHRWLPRAKPSQRNTQNALKTTVMGVWRETTGNRATIALTAEPSEVHEYIATAHISGVDEDGTTLSSERYSISLSFNSDGEVAQREVKPISGGSNEGVDALLKAIDVAETSLSSKAWQERWNSMHSAYRSIYLTSMTYYVHSLEGSQVIDRWIKLAQKCGIRAVRFDQPSWAVAETLGELLKAKLDEATAFAESGKRSSQANATRKLSSIVDLGETIESLQSILGSVGERMSQAVETLKEQWTQAQEQSKKKPKKLQEFTALTDLGRSILDRPEALGYIMISNKGLQIVDQVKAIMPSIGSDDPNRRAFETLIELSQTPVEYREEDVVSVLKPLITEGWVQDNVTPTDVLIDSLSPLSQAPIPSDEIDLGTIPSHYRTTLTRTFKE